MVSRWTLLRNGEEVLKRDRAWISWRQSLIAVFVPAGYPGSVAEGYATFQIFDSLQALCSYLRGVLSTQAILQGLGVGSEGADAMAATTQWVYRDGAGMLGGLLFAWYGAGRFDANVKGWRLFADLSVDVALTLELASPLLCESSSQLCFTTLVSSANVLKAMCGVAAGATRAVITNHFAKVGNLADVQAKEGSQETAVNLVGMYLGLKLATLVSENEGLQHIPWLIFATLTMLHVICNYLAVRALQLKHINDGRLSICLARFSKNPNADLSVKAVNDAESIVRSAFKLDSAAIAMGVPPNSPTDVENLANSGGTCTFISPNKILLTASASQEDILRLIARSRLDSPMDAEKFLGAMQHYGWNIDTLYLRDEKYRIQWSSSDKKTA